MKKLLILLIFSLFSFQSHAGSCPDGSDPVKSISADGTYFVYNCAGSSNDASASTNSASKASKSSNKQSSKKIDRFGGISEIPEDANPNFETLQYYLFRYLYSFNKYPFCGTDNKELHCEEIPPKFTHSIEPSNTPYQFHTDLREDRYITQQMQDTALLSYLLYEDGKIVIDEITPKDRFGGMFRDSSKFHSQSVAKTLIGYVAGHAICKGYIDSVDSRLNDWPILENTLYHNQKLIDVLNMASGTQAYFNGSNRFTNSNRAVTSPTVEDIMKRELKGSKKSSSIYNYNNLNPNVVGSYLIYKLGADNFQALLDDVFKNKARIEGEAFFLKNEFAEKDDLSMWSQFYATRYDYLRIAKAMLDDWENDTCAGQYLKTIHERRINKGNWGGKPGTRVSLPEAYAGFFHTGYLGMANRPVMGMDGYGGQTILIDFERGRIIATQSIHDNMKFPQPGGIDFKKISYERIKNGKPSSKVKPPPEPNVDSQQILKERNAAIETEKKGKRYWDDYYDCKETIEGKSNIASCMDKKLKRREKVEKLKSSSGGSILLFEDFENLDERELLTDDREDQWYVKKDNDDNSMYCNKKDINDDYAGFNLGSKNWRDYSISYRMKFATGKGGELETHIRKNNNRQGEYRSVINSKTGNTYLKYVKGADKINVKIANGSRAPIRDKWADIQLIASGKTIVYIVNGIVVASIEDDRLKKGALMFAVTSKSELCLDDIVIKKEGTQEETPAYQNIAKAQSEGSELFKDIKTSNTFDGYYGFTNMMPPSTSLGNGTLEINNGILTISQGRGDLTPKYESFEGRIDQNGDIKANFYFAPCRSCGLEDKFIVFEGNINKKKLSGKYNDSQIYFYLTGKKGDVIKEEKTEKEIIEIIELNTENTQTIEIAIPKNSRTWDYPFLIFDNYEANGSNDYYKFQSNLKEDEDVLKNLENNHQTGLISYLLFENNKIVIDESDIPVKVQGDRIINGLLPSHSMGKSLVSYVTGHAICEGYIESVDERLSGWDVIENTLYEDQILIDLLNMSAGDQEYIGERLDPQVDNLLKKSNVNSNLIPLKRIMELDLLNSKKSKPLYNYSALTTNVILNYVIHKTDDDWQKLLNKVFNEHVKVKNSVYFSKTPKVGRYEELVGYEQTGRYSFYATRYDYLRIAKTMMEDWKNETCAGKYLKTIYDRRIEKADDIKISDSVGLYTQKYGGQFHFDIYGFKKGRKIIGMDGFAGQQILIDLDNEKIIVVNSLLKKYDWNKIVYERIKNLQPHSGPAKKIEKAAKVESAKVETSDSDPTISEVIEVTHGDKLILDIAEPHELAGSNIKVSLKDIDVPDATRSCPKQMELGLKVKDYVSKKLENASSIKLTNFRKTNTKIIAQVIVDGVDLGGDLVSKGYASEEYGFWKPYFCSALSATNQADQYVDTDQKKAIFWYERSIVLDPDGSKNQQSHFALSQMYSNLGNTDKSLENLKKSASLEWIPAMEQLGSDYLNGNGVKKDPNQGKKWLKKAFDKGSQRAEGIYCGSLPKAKQKTCKF